MMIPHLACTTFEPRATSDAEHPDGPQQADRNRSDSSSPAHLTVYPTVVPLSEVLGDLTCWPADAVDAVKSAFWAVDYLTPAEAQALVGDLGATSIREQVLPC